MLIARGIKALFPTIDISHFDQIFTTITKLVMNTITPIYHSTELNITTDVTTKQLITVANLNSMLSSKGM